jgi:hypothetical protein
MTDGVAKGAVGRWKRQMSAFVPMGRSRGAFVQSVAPTVAADRV